MRTELIDYINKWREKQIRNPTPYEMLFAAKLICHKIDFIREYPILTERSFFTADFYLPKYKLLIEIDGLIHETEQQIVKDTVKDIVYKSFGYNVLRIKNNEVELFEVDRVRKYKKKKPTR
jgi:very-short-patch-repair endonuclease